MWSHGDIFNVVQHSRLKGARLRSGERLEEHGDDFASTIGAGGVVGTKFVWPDPGPKFKDVNLTAAKEERWKKWDRAVQRKDAFEGRVQGPLCDRLRRARGIRNRERGRETGGRFGSVTRSFFRL